jgi:hypothetical protein
VSPIRRKIIRPESDILEGELRKIKPPKFNGENRKGEEARAWLLETVVIFNSTKRGVYDFNPFIMI